MAKKKMKSVKLKRLKFKPRKIKKQKRPKIYKLQAKIYPGPDKISSAFVLARNKRGALLVLGTKLNGLQNMDDFAVVRYKKSDEDALLVSISVPSNS